MKSVINQGEGFAKIRYVKPRGPGGGGSQKSRKK